MSVPTESSEPNLIVALHLSSLEEAVEALEAASILGLGARLRNELEVGQHDHVDTQEEAWILDVLSEVPARSQPHS